MKYKIVKTALQTFIIEAQFDKSSTSWIPVSINNTDYANFKKEVLAGAELQDADGNVMTQEQANQFVGGLA